MAEPVIPHDFGVSHHQRGNNISGIYGYIDRVIPHSDIEPFFLHREQPQGSQRENAYGIRTKGKAMGRLEYMAEGILERGSDGPDSIRAWAASLGAAYSFSSLEWHPRIFVQYDYASGDSQPGDRMHSTFDTMYPTAHDRLGVSDLFGWQNLMAARGGMTIEPYRRWTISGQCLNFSLAAAADGVYNSSGGLLFRDPAGNSGTHIGEEFDLYTWYELNRHVNVGTGIVHLMPGGFLARIASPSSYTYPYFAINFKDNGKTRD
jgi:hypothetical protein